MSTTTLLVNAISLIEMTQDRDPASIAELYKHLTEGEQRASGLEKMLDALEAKMDQLLADAEAELESKQVEAATKSDAGDAETETETKTETDKQDKSQ
ncbi:uncharacterized protein RJT21DRAFT_13262 [Scheffersomyces amazonensis]|uniref:uncharacterized protein n=1 Tax=Scheffersomyces amazonensis TaxID=1078765 RepID=UPI00315D62FE